MASAGNSGASVAGRVTTPENPGGTRTAPPSAGGVNGTGVTGSGVVGMTGGGTVTDASTPSAAIDAEGRKTIARLEKLEGEAFDKQFLTAMVRGHQKALAKVKGLQGKKVEAELAGLLSDARTMIENHLTRAKELQRPASASLTPAEMLR